MKYEHKSVMYRECIDFLKINSHGIYVDGTLGGAGHSLGIVEKLDDGKLVANDLDLTAIENAKEVLKEHIDKVTFIHGDYKNITDGLDELEILEVDGILLDLGVSSHQIDTAERGFSYMKDAPLDMRMDNTQNFSASDVVNTYSKENLLDILYKYGEENFAKRIVENIIKAREEKKIETTLELSALIERAYPKKLREVGGHPAKKTFQAIRIEVNSELKGLGESIQKMALRLKKGGRMAVITFHSLEDRIVKIAFNELEKDCICDRRAPICTCDKRQEVIKITKKPITATQAELENNKRAKSAKLRVVERV